MTVTVETIQDTLTRIESMMYGLQSQLQVSGSQIVVVEGLSDISQSLGLVKAGEFRSGTGTPGFGFTGVRMGSPGWLYDSQRYAIVGLNNDTMQFGLSSEDGNVYAGEGRVRLNQYGIQLDATTDVGVRGTILFRYDDAGTIKDIGEIFGNYDVPNNAASMSLLVHATAGNPWDTVDMFLGASRLGISGYMNTVAYLDLHGDGRAEITSTHTIFTPSNHNSLTLAEDSEQVIINGGQRGFVSGTYADFAAVSIEPPTWNLSGAGAVTVDYSATVYIEGPPSLGAGVAANHNDALHVYGDTRITGDIDISGVIRGTVYDSSLGVSFLDFSASSTIVGWSSYTAKYINYVRLGNFTYVQFFIDGTSNSATTSFTLSNTCLPGQGAIALFQAMDNGGAPVAGVLQLVAGTATVNLYATAAAASWTASGTKQVRGQFWYMSE